MGGNCSKNGEKRNACKLLMEEPEGKNGMCYLLPFRYLWALLLGLMLVYAISAVMGCGGLQQCDSHIL
jgi:hypothetical protein